MKKPILISQKPLEVYSLSPEEDKYVDSKCSEWIEGADFLLKKNQKKIVFFHGYGANAFDLMSLASELRLKSEAEFYFPNGCYDLPFEMGGGIGKAWFEIPVSQMQKMMTTGEPLQMRNINPEGLSETTQKAVSWILEMKIPPQDLILGGFSQGAMVALEVALTLEQRCAGVVLFSSTLIKESETKKRLLEKKGLLFYQSHGVMDPVLPYEMAVALHQTLLESGAQGKLQSFQGGHEIPRAVLEGVGSFIDQLS